MAKRANATLVSNDQHLQKERLKKLLLFVTSSRQSLLGIVTISSLNTLARMLINTKCSEIVPVEENLPHADHLMINLTQRSTLLFDHLKERAQRRAKHCLRLPVWRGKSKGIRDSSAGYQSLGLKNETKNRVLNCHIRNNLSSKFAIPSSLGINIAVIQNSSFRNEMLNEILCPELSKTEYMIIRVHLGLKKP